jgi:hypothetical protein
MGVHIDSATYRKQADELREMAKASTHPEIRASLIRAAQIYDRLAETGEYVGPLRNEP